MRKATSRHPLIVAAYTALTFGSIAGLCWLAPLEYGTGRWLGLAEVLAVVVPCLIDSYVALSVLTGRDRQWALPIAGLSGGVGQLHAAGVLPATSRSVRAWVATLAVVLAVAVTARLKPLVHQVVDAVHAAVAAELAAAEAAQDARTAAAQEAARADAQAAHDRELEAARLAHEHRLAEAALTRTDTPHDEPAQPAPVRRTTKRTATARKATAQADDLRRRTSARESFEASVRTGAALGNVELARLLYGVDEPDQRQVGAARARASEWRRAVETETRTEAAR